MPALPFDGRLRRFVLGQLTGLLVVLVSVSAGAALDPAPAHAQEPADLLRIESNVTYDVRPDLGPVAVTWSVTIDNNDPATVEPVFGTGLAYDEISVPVLRGAGAIQAIDADGVALGVTVVTPEEGPVESAGVRFSRPLHFEQQYSFTLNYELATARSDALLVTPAYVFLPAVVGGDATRVQILTPDDAAWDVVVEPLACPATAPGTLRCGSSEFVQIAARVEVTRVDALTSIESTVALGKGPVSLIVSYLPGEEGWAERVQTLAARALPLMEDAFGHDYSGPDVIEISQRGQGEIAGYGGTFGCAASTCSIGLSPVADDGIVLHEFAHLWTEQYITRWLAEGLSEFMAETVAALLGDLSITSQLDEPDDAIELQLDEWENSRYLLGASGEELALEATGYVLSARFFETLQALIGPTALQNANAAAAALRSSVDSKTYLTLLEDASSRRLDGLFLEHVFAPSYAPILEQRRAVTDALAALQIETAAAGLSIPASFEQAIADWRFDDVAGELVVMRSVLNGYAEARARVAEPRDAWMEIGLLGKDPDGALREAATAFAAADFATASERASAAAGTIDDARRSGQLRVAGAVTALAAVAVGLLAFFWLLRGRTVVR